MILNELTAEHPDVARVIKLYDESFPESERVVPMDVIVTLLDSRPITLLGIYPDDEPDVFAGFLLMYEWEAFAYLWFFATCPEMRSKGIGGKAMQALEERYGDKAIVFDYESVFEECDNMAQRERRRAFYLRNGYLETGWFVRANGVELIVASSKEDFDINDYVAMLEEWAKDAPDSAEGVEMPEVYQR